MNLSTAVKILETECCTQISIEACHDAFADCEDLKLAPDQYLHHSLFCRERKLADHNKSCASNKKRSLEIASCGRRFCGTCPFGVRELAQPVIFRKKLAAVCYFTIFPSTVPLEILRKKSQWLNEFIQLILCVYTENQVPEIRRNSAEYYRKRILNYFDLHYMENISESDLAEELGLNCTYFSSLFRKITGKTFRQMLTGRRIDEAKIYLKLHRHMRISHIAHLCGFSDSNYFSLVFHKQTGISPKNYRGCIEKGS
ncbi:MAG: helix-turn-helix transcriptional regulator [Lentisphaeria bacterium]|nr:helix-turn-helix transcriptional regulator [Lentisphaeria bacterium]MBQ8754088.1 helix-turn-helix transcriptional regulator [Lentisphaeria bacterium]